MQFNSVKDVLVNWRELHSDKPISWFAKRVGVSHSTIQRIIDGNTKDPDFPTGRSICLNALEKQEDAFELLKSFYPDKQSYLTEESKSFRTIEKFSDPALLNAFSDYYKWQLLCLTAIKPIPLRKLSELGKVYLKKSQEMVKEGLLVDKDDHLAKSSGGFCFSGKILVQTVNYIARSLQEKLERGESDINGQIYFDIDGYSEIGKAEVNKIIVECSLRIANLKKEGVNCGDLPVAVMMTLSDLI